jgi:hypothetical protein
MEEEGMEERKGRKKQHTPPGTTGRKEKEERREREKTEGEGKE